MSVKLLINFLIFLYQKNIIVSENSEYKTLEIFILQIQRRNFHFNFNNLIIFDFKLLSSIIALVFSYTIVIVQMTETVFNKEYQ